ncbi:MAG: flagellar hook assembly protein FlgD [Geminicoccaceae bacterium]
MAVSAVTGSGADTVRGSGQSLAANFDNFLKLLTTQLRNQDPVAPMDTNAFTSQLVQFASVEQAIKSNDRLKELGELIQASGTTSALSMLGRDAVVGTDRVGLGTTGDATIRYRLPEPATHVTATVVDTSGRIVRTLAGTTAAGENTLTWDGLDGAGQRAAPGTYRIQLDAVEADGTAIAVEQYLAGTVEAIEPDAGAISLIVAGAKVSLNDVRAVHAPAAA